MIGNEWYILSTDMRRERVESFFRFAETVRPGPLLLQHVDRWWCRILDERNFNRPDTAILFN